MDRRLEDLVEYASSREGRENMALALIVAGSVVGIVALGRR